MTSHQLQHIIVATKASHSEPIGFVSFRVDDKTKKIFIDLLLVEKACQHKGVGSCLLYPVALFAARYQYTILLEVANDVTAFYRKTFPLSMWRHENLSNIQSEKRAIVPIKSKL